MLAMTTIANLTRAQREQIPEYVTQWSADSRRLDLVDVAETERSLDAVYRAMHLSAPTEYVQGTESGTLPSPLPRPSTHLRLPEACQRKQRSASSRAASR